MITLAQTIPSGNPTPYLDFIEKGGVIAIFMVTSVFCGVILYRWVLSPSLSSLREITAAQERTASKLENLGRSLEAMEDLPKSAGIIEEHVTELGRHVVKFETNIQRMERALP